MSGQSEDVRRERARLGGQVGGPIAQQVLKKRGAGFFNIEAQRQRGRKGAAVNRVQGTGAFDPANLEHANAVLKQNPEKYLPQQLKNLTQGRQTQKEKGIGIGDPDLQRFKSLMRFGTIELNGKEYSLNTEHRIYVCETTLAYYLRYAPKGRKKKNSGENTSTSNSKVE